MTPGKLQILARASAAGKPPQKPQNNQFYNTISFSGNRGLVTV
jgi:hypothetical protein